MCFASGDAIGCGPACVVCPVPLGASQATCDGTKCGFVCNSGFHACESTCELDDSVSACGDSCAVCPTDPNGTAVCVAGDCAITCNDGYHYCSDVKKCLKDTDQASCGTSCTPCPAIRGGTATCEDGVCGGKCPETQELCNGACIDPAEVCGSCPEGTHNCNGVCASDTSENSCGTSCTPCPAPEGSERSTCTDGTCGFTCSPGRHRCGSVCAADDDASYCGSTCKKCLADSHGTAICQNGECSVRCDSRYHNCGGTCVSNSALETCGLTECTTPCQKPTGGDVTCNGTACVQTCPTNLPQNCNGTCIAANGACDGTCPDGQKRCSSTNTCIPKEGCCSATECPAEGANIVPTCTNNICGTACSPSTYTKCGGTDCFDLTSNATHCGACTTNCASTPATPKCHASECVQCLGNGDCPTNTGRTTCSNYKCVCPPGLTDCGTAGCVNTSNDNNNCGGCGSGGSSRVCVAPNTCGGSGTAGLCGCTANCGTRVCGAAPNGCGSCGTCSAGSSCNSSGQCACVPKTAAEVCGSRVCGTVSDGCTGTVACGTQGGACPSGKQCNSSGQCVCPLGAAQSVCGTCLGWDFESGGDNLNDTNGWVRNPDGGWSSTYPQIQRVLSPTYNSSGHSLAITLNHDGGFAVKVPVCPSTDLSNLTFSAQFRIHDLGGASTVDVMNLMFSAPENGFTPAGWITTRPVGVDSWIPVTGGQEWPNGTAYIGLYFSVDSSYDNYWSGTVYLDNVMFQ